MRMQILNTIKSKLINNVPEQMKPEGGKVRVLNLGEVSVVSGGPEIKNNPTAS
jgi:hypothetical protein